MFQPPIFSWLLASQHAAIRFGRRHRHTINTRAPHWWWWWWQRRWVLCVWRKHMQPHLHHTTTAALAQAPTHRWVHVFTQHSLTAPVVCCSHALLCAVRGFCLMHC